MITLAAHVAHAHAQGMPIVALDGESIRTNTALLHHNAQVAAQVAVRLKACED